ncbi:hypothetical protein L195_g056856, partial [Trifolium pratense]
VEGLLSSEVLAAFK